MSRLETPVTQLAYIIADGSSWRWNGAFQGSYGKGAPRVGVLMFGGLRNIVKWSDMKVKGVQIWFRYGSAGGAHTKTIGLYATTRNTVGGSAGDMLGQWIGQIYTGVTAYNNNGSVYFNETTNVAAFRSLASWIENGSSIGLAMFLQEYSTSSTSYSENYLIVEDAAIGIDYELKGSDGEIDPSSVAVGETISLSINPIQSTYPVSHKVEYTLGSKSSGVYSLVAGVTNHQYTIPSSWLSELSGVTSATATCTLSTIENGEDRGYRNIDFVVNVPDSYMPVINSFSVKRYTTAIDDQGQTIYIESLGGAHVWVNVNAYIDRDGGLNPGTASIRYYKFGDEENAQTVNLTWPNDQLTINQDMTLLPQAFSLTDSWVFELSVSNGHSTIVSTTRIEKSWAPLHIAGSGYGVGIGMYSDGTEQDPKFQVAWPATFTGGINGISNYNADEIGTETATGGYWMDQPIFRTIFHIRTNATGYVNLGSLLSLPDMITHCFGTITADNTVRTIPFASWGGVNWSASILVYQNTGLVQLLLGSSFSANTNDIYVVVEYTKQVGS